MAFPKLIHVYEEDAGDGTTFLCVSDQGVVGVTEPGMKLAIYQKVDEGTVRIEKSFVSKKGKR